MGLVRDRLLAHHFGAGHVLDIYYAAFRIPDLIFASVASLFSVSVLIPFLAEHMKKGDAAVKHFINQIFTVFFGLIVMVSLAAFWCMPELIPRLIPGFAAGNAGAEALPQLILLSRILLLSPFFLGLSNFIAGITQINGRFFLYGVTPLLYNAGILIGILFFYDIWGMAGLGWGVALGALLHFAVQVPWISYKKLTPAFTTAIDWRMVGRVMAVSLPRTVALSANQMATFFLVAIASTMAAGSIAIFNLAFNLQSVPLSIIGVSYSAAAFPILSKLAAGGDTAEFMNRMRAAARHIVFWSLPVVALFVVLRAQIVRVVLGASPLFTWTDTRLTAAALAIFVVSLIPQSLVLLFVRAFYAHGKTMLALITNVAAAALIVIAAWFLSGASGLFPDLALSVKGLLRVAGLDSGVLILALAYSFGMFLNLLFHWIVFRKEHGKMGGGIVLSAMQSFIASLLLGVTAYFGLDIFVDIFGLTTLIGVFLQGLSAGILGIAVAIGSLYVMGNTEIAEMWRTLHMKIGRGSAAAVAKAGPGGAPVVADMGEGQL